MAVELASALLFFICSQATLEVTASMQAYGCQEGWTNYEDHCYTVLVGDWDSHSAKNVCIDLGATATSVWSPAEREFIASLWQFPQGNFPYLWTGLKGSSSGSWYWEDRSSFSVLQKDTEEYWSVLDELPSMRGSSAGQCVALSRDGTPTLLACDAVAGGVACKKPLVRVYADPSLLNSTSLPLEPPLDAVHLFLRVLPPALISFPSASISPLEELEVTTDTHCAFMCHSSSPCRIIELSCITQFHCGTYKCQLFEG